MISIIKYYVERIKTIGKRLPRKSVYVYLTGEISKTTIYCVVKIHRVASNNLIYCILNDRKGIS